MAGFELELMDDLDWNMRVVKSNQTHESAGVPLLLAFLITQIWQTGG